MLDPQPSQKIVCVDNSQIKQLTLNKEYKCEHTYMHPNGSIGVFVINDAGVEADYFASRFRPAEQPGEQAERDLEAQRTRANTAEQNAYAPLNEALDKYGAPPLSQFAPLVRLEKLVEMKDAERQKVERERDEARDELLKTCDALNWNRGNAPTISTRAASVYGGFTRAHEKIAALQAANTALQEKLGKRDEEWTNAFAGESDSMYRRAVSTPEGVASMEQARREMHAEADDCNTAVHWAWSRWNHYAELVKAGAQQTEQNAAFEEAYHASLDEDGTLHTIENVEALAEDGWRQHGELRARIATLEGQLASAKKYTIAVDDEHAAYSCGCTASGDLVSASCPIHGDPQTKLRHGSEHHRLECECDVCYPPTEAPKSEPKTCGKHGCKNPAPHRVIGSLTYDACDEHRAEIERLVESEDGAKSEQPGFAEWCKHGRGGSLIVPISNQSEKVGPLFYKCAKDGCPKGGQLLIPSHRDKTIADGTHLPSDFIPCNKDGRELPNKPVKVERWFKCVKKGCEVARRGIISKQCDRDEAIRKGTHTVSDFIPCDRAGVPLSEGAKQ